MQQHDRWPKRDSQPSFDAVGLTGLGKFELIHKRSTSKSDMKSRRVAKQESCLFGFLENGAPLRAAAEKTSVICSSSKQSSPAARPCSCDSQPRLTPPPSRPRIRLCAALLRITALERASTSEFALGDRESLCRTPLLAASRAARASLCFCLNGS